MSKFDVDFECSVGFSAYYVAIQVEADSAADAVKRLGNVLQEMVDAHISRRMDEMTEEESGS